MPIHELLHAFSVGGNDILSYRRSRDRRWEEGLVEILQRHLRRDLLENLGVHLDPTLIEQVDRESRYQPLVEQLEVERQALGNPPLIPFYRGLLAVPLADRERHVALAKARRYGLG